MPDILRASVYDFLKLVHVIATVVWIGAAVTLEYQFAQAEGARDAQGVRRLIAFNAWLTKRLYVPTSLSTVIFGVLAVWQGPWQFTQFWVLVGIGLYVVLFLMGVTYFSPEAERIMKLYEEGGDASPAAHQRAQKYMLLERVDLILMFVAVVDMIFKPQTAGDLRFWIVSALGAAVLGGLAMRGKKQMS